MEISPYDRLETLKYSSVELLEMLDNLESSLPSSMNSKVWALKNKFKNLSSRWFDVCEKFTDDLQENQQRYESLVQAEDETNRQHSYQKQKKLQRKEQEIQDKQNDFQKSMKNVQELCQQNLDALKAAVKGQRKAKLKLEAEQLSQLKGVEEEMTSVLEEPIISETSGSKSLLEICEESMLGNFSGPQFTMHNTTQSDTNYEEEFERILLAQQVPEGEINDSKISMEKSQEKWIDELESENEEQSVDVKPKDMIKILRTLEEQNKLDDFQSMHKIKSLLSEDTVQMKLGLQYGKILLKNNGIDLNPNEAKNVTKQDSKNYNAPFASPRRFAHIKKKAPEIVEESLIDPFHPIFDQNNDLLSNLELLSYIPNDEESKEFSALDLDASRFDDPSADVKQQLDDLQEQSILRTESRPKCPLGNSNEATKGY